MSANAFQAGMLAAVCALPQIATAGDAYPVRPVRLIVIASAGGASDVLARLLAERLAERLGQAVVIDNRPGAGGVLGTELVARATADGYTLLVGSPAAFVIGPNLGQKLPYDVQRDFAPVSPFASLAFVLSVHPGVAARNVQDLVALARAQPGQLNFGSAGNATATHLAAELFRRMANIDLVHVPFKGSAPAMLALIGGQVQLAFDAAITSLPQVRAARIRPLAVSAVARSSLLPEVPTVAESGFKGYEATTWFGVFAPARTPAPIVQRLAGAMREVMGAADVRARLLAQGAEAATGTPEAFGRFVREERARYAALIRSAGIRAE